MLSFPLCVVCTGCDRAAAARIWRKRRKSSFLSCRTEAVYYRKVIKGRCDLPAPTFISKVSLLSLCSYFQRGLLKVEEIRAARTLQITELSESYVFILLTGQKLEYLFILLFQIFYTSFISNNAHHPLKCTHLSSRMYLTYFNVPNSFKIEQQRPIL